MGSGGQSPPPPFGDFNARGGKASPAPFSAALRMYGAPAPPARRPVSPSPKKQFATLHPKDTPRRVCPCQPTLALPVDNYCRKPQKTARDAGKVFRARRFFRLRPGVDCGKLDATCTQMTSREGQSREGRIGWQEDRNTLSSMLRLCRRCS